MANIKSQVKRNRQNEVRRLRNKSVRSEMKTRVKHAVDAARGDHAGDDAAGDDAAGVSAEAIRQAVKRIDKAAAQGVIHRNQAANRKSRLMRRLAALSR